MKAHAMKPTPTLFDTTEAEIEQAAPSKPPHEDTMVPATSSPASPKGRRIVLVDPAIIRPSPLNPRDVTKLTRENTADLRDMIQMVGQLNPGAVRRIKGDPHYQYELLAGTRRHRCITDLRADGHDMLFAAVVHDVDDLDGAKISDAENRGIAAISEYEYAVYVERLLTGRFGGIQARLADAMKIDAGRLSRLLALARWEPELLGAYGDPRLIRQQDVVALQAVKDERRDRMLEAARTLSRKQQHLEIDGDALIDPVLVRRRLLAAASDRSEPAPADVRLGGRLKITKQSRNGLSLYVAAGDPGQHEAILAAIEAALSRFEAK